MGLTSIATEVFLIVLTILAIALVLYFWKKLASRSVLLRLIILVLCQALAVTSVGVVINRDNGFYSSWQDLFGIKIDYSKTAVKYANLKVIDAKTLKKYPRTPDGQVIVKEIIRGRLSNVSGVVYFVLPKNQVDLVRRGQKIDLSQSKIVEFINGYPSGPETWFHSMNVAHEIALSDQVSGRKSIIAVIPTVNVDGSKDLECMNFPGGGTQAETWLSHDIHSYAVKRLGIPETKFSLLGVSTGGWCTAMLAIKHPNLFDGGVSISGYYAPAFNSGISNNDREYLTKKYDLSKLEQKLTNPIRLLLIASAQDEYSFSRTKRFIKAQHPMIISNYVEIPFGGHNNRVWKKELPRSFFWILKL